MMKLICQALFYGNNLAILVKGETLTYQLYYPAHVQVNSCWDLNVFIL